MDGEKQDNFFCRSFDICDYSKTGCKQEDLECQCYGDCEACNNYHGGTISDYCKNCKYYGDDE